MNKRALWVAGLVVVVACGKKGGSGGGGGSGHDPHDEATTRIVVSVDAASKQVFHQELLAAQKLAKEATQRFSEDLDVTDKKNACNGAPELEYRVVLDDSVSLDRKFCRQVAEETSAAFRVFLSKLPEPKNVPEMSPPVGSGDISARPRNPRLPDGTTERWCLNPCCWFPGGDCSGPPLEQYCCGGGSRGRTKNGWPTQE